MESSPADTNDWRRQATRAYGTHITGVVIAVPSVDSLALRLDTAGVQHGPLADIILERKNGRSFGLVGPQPLGISFVEFGKARPAPVDDTTRMPRNRLRRISWLLVTASPREEANLRKVFAALGLRQLHEGCCDYWLLGPPENRTAIRFELPTTTFRGGGDWLSIESGGVVYAY